MDTAPPMTAPTPRRASTKSFSAALVAAGVFVTASALVSLTVGQDQDAPDIATWSLRGTIVPGAPVAPTHSVGRDKPARQTIASLLRS